MKKLSITARITIWYATFMVIITSVLIAVALAAFEYYEDVRVTDTTTGRLILFGFILFVVLVANLGGYRIAKRAYKPVGDIIDTVEGIRDDADLSRRLELGKNRDELYRLSDTFNQMIERIETDMNREKQFTSDVAHELKTPISVINYQSKYAMEDESYQAEAIRSIYEESQRMATTVSNLLTLSRSDEGRLKIEHEPVDLSLVCDGIAEQQNVVLSEQGIAIHTDIKDKVYVYGDEVMLVRMILNLIDNARKYGCDKNDRIELSLDVAGTDAIITVRDFGQGMTKDVLAHIWDRFYRADASRKDNDSTGLGLPIVKAIAEVHGGKIEVESEAGKGTTFTVRLPLNNVEK